MSGLYRKELDLFMMYSFVLKKQNLMLAGIVVYQN